MSVVSLNYTPLSETKSRPGVFARILDAIYRSRMAQAEALLRLHGYDLRINNVTQPSSETRRTS